MADCDKENIVPRLTRAAAKRCALAAADPPPRKRTRYALSELPALNNAGIVPSRAGGAKPVSRPRKKDNDKEKDLSAPGCSPSCDDDPQFCPDCADDIVTYLRSMEMDPTRRPVVNYIETVQREVTATMRGILMDWLVEVADEYKLLPDTLFLAVSLVDRFLSGQSVEKHRLQLLGVSAMLVASKYEEISPPQIKDFCYITDNTYDRHEVSKMERGILDQLSFQVGFPTAKFFLRQFLTADGDSEKLEFLGSYLTELSLVDYGCVGFLPSTIAASAVFLARFTLDPNSHPWSEKLLSVTGYTAARLRECISIIHDLQLGRRAASLVAVREKYRHHKFKCVSELRPLEEIPAAYVE